MYLSLYCKGLKRVTQGLRVRRSWRPNKDCNILTPTLMAISFVSFSFAWCSTGGPGAQLSAGWWLSLLHLITNGSGFPYHILPLTHLNSNSDFLSWPSYIIVQRPLNFWNGMFDRHQAEITVMQFTGHSLPVHQSMSVSWAFTLSHFVSQIHLRDFFRLLDIGMCHFLPVHHFGMACLAGSIYNNSLFS